MTLGSVFEIFKSLRFTIFLIASLMVLFVAGILVPQKDLLGRQQYMAWKAARPGLVTFLESMEFTDIYASPLALALWGLFFLNLVVIIIGRIPVVWRRCMKTEMASSVDSLSRARCYVAVEDRGVDDLRAAAGGYVFRSLGGAFHAVKNRYSPLATVVFHFSFLLVLVGGVTSFYTRFSANADVAVGESFSSQLYYNVKLPAIGDVPHAVLRVDDIRPRYYKGTLAVGLDIAITTRGGQSVMGINRPYREGALSFVFLNLDMLPLFVIEDGSGNEIDGAYTKLKVLKGMEDGFSMAGFDFKAFFYPDGAVYNAGAGAEELSGVPQALKQSPGAEEEQRQSREVTDPAFEITAFRDGQPLSSGIIRPGESLQLDSHRLLFKELSYWAKFQVVSEHGLGIAYAGFALMIAALCVRFLLYRRDLWGVVKDGQLHIAGRAEYFPALFDDEFGGIIKKLKSGA